MASESINDWTIKVGFDDSAVKKGAARVEKIMQRLARTQAKLNHGGTSSLAPSGIRQPKGITNQLVKEQTELKTINSLEAKRLQLRRSIERAKGLGISTGGFNNSLRGSKTPRLEQRRLELENLITTEKSKQGALAAKATKTPSAVKQPRQFALSEERQLKTANSIDSVLRRAGRQLGQNSNEFKKVTAEAEKLKKAITSVGSRVGLEKLNNKIRVLRDGVTKTTAEMRKMNSVVTSQDFAINGLKNSVANLTRSMISIFAILEGGRAILRTGLAFETMNATMLMTSGSTQKASEDFKFLISLANQAGFSVLELAKSFSKFGLAGRSAGLTDGEVKRSFEDLSITIRATGLAQDKANLAFLALQQMLSNGVVSMQELKLQLSEQLPQAMSTAETALRNLGFTSGSVKDIISTGAVESGAFVKELTRLMKKQAVDTGAYEKSINSATAELGRFGTSIDLLIKGMFEVGGLGAGMTRIFSTMKSTVESITPVLVSFTTGVGAVFNAIGVLIWPVTALIGLLGEGVGLTLVMSIVTAKTLQWAASLLFGKAAMDSLTYSGIANFLKGLSLSAIGTGIATKGFMGWTASIWSTIWSLRALKLALGPIGLAFLALEGVGALMNVGSPSPTNQGSKGSSSVTNNTNVEMTINEATDAHAVREQVSQTLQDVLSGNPVIVR